jgi:deazaflavin-dependent oxidoreductase (nitroreductase family)
MRQHDGMAYLKPQLLTKRVFNPVAMKLGISGTVELVVPRRRSGGEQHVPVIPVEHDGALHVVSTRGESDWVRNIRAAGRVELRGKHGSGTYRATEVPVEQREPIIAAYRAKAGRTVDGYWKKLPDPGDHPVFRLEA